MHNFLSTQTRLATTSAKNILKKFNIQERPIDVEKIAKLLKIKIVKLSFENNEVSGLLKRKGSEGKPVMAINENHPKERQRFTIAHEIGHFILHDTSLVHVDTEKVYFRDNNSSTATKAKEIQANQFAAELLMPNFLLIEDLKKILDADGKVIDAIPKLSKEYKVSDQAMLIKVGKMMA